MITIKRVPGRKIPEPETLKNGQEQKIKNRTWRSKRRMEDRTVVKTHDAVCRRRPG